MTMLGGRDTIALKALQEADHEGSYHAGAHLLTQEERDREVERGIALARRECSGTATIADMRRMMTKLGAPPSGTGSCSLT